MTPLAQIFHPHILADVRTATALPLLQKHQEELGIEIALLETYHEGEDRLVQVAISPTERVESSD